MLKRKELVFVLMPVKVTLCKFQDADLERVDYTEPLENCLPEMRIELEELKKLNVKFVKLVGKVDAYAGFDNIMRFI